jgi:hypothetical protein
MTRHQRIRLETATVTRAELLRRD